MPSIGRTTNINVAFDLLFARPWDRWIGRFSRNASGDIRLSARLRVAGDVLDRLLAGRNADGAVIFTRAGAQRRVCLSASAGSSGPNPCPNAVTVCHCALFFHSPVSSFQDFVVATENLVTVEPFGSCLLSAFRSDESDDGELINVHVFSSFCPFSLGTPKRAAAAPKPRECFLWGPQEFPLKAFREADEQ